MIAIRGATTAERNEKEAVLICAEELLSKLIEDNGLKADEIVAIVFSATDDLTKVFPARAAIALGLNDTPLFCVRELCIEDALTMCVRILLFANKQIPKSKVKHIYLRGAAVLRPDLSKGR
ncbi:MAG: chorismate mutase [Clostridia bacterium]|nr:chorismate mutase [Clostridia bacterium]